jgi:hypothetical protein
MKRFLANSAVLLLSIVVSAGLVYYALHPAGGTTPPNQSAAKGDGLEGAVLFSDAKVAAAGIELQTAGPGTLQDSLLLNGMIQPNQEALVQVTPRFPGIVRDVRKRIGDQVAKSALARAVVKNHDMRLRPGLFVTGRVLLSAKPVAVAVKSSALQTTENRTVVFVRSGEKFEVRDVEIGDRDREQVEILFGVLEGDVYAAKNSFIVKAELAKASVADDDD